MGTRKRIVCWRLSSAAGVLSVCCTVLAAFAAIAEVPSPLGPCAVVASGDGRTLYVACADAKQVAVVDVQQRSVTRRIDMPAEPTGIAMCSCGARLYVTCAAPESTVCVVDVELRAASCYPLRHQHVVNDVAGFCWLVIPRVPEPAPRCPGPGLQ